LRNIGNLLQTKQVNADSLLQQFKEISTTISLPLWRFMRHMSPKLGAVQVATAKRHAQLREEVNAAIRQGTNYPWALLSKLQAQKFYSDIVESLLGAVWIDSGSFDTCQEMVERMGILPYMKRILRDGVRVWHPKEEIGVLADSETVTYVIEKRKNDDGEEEGSEYWCKVLIGDMEIVEVGGGVCKEEVKTKAAEAAVKLLKEKKVEEDAGSIEAVVVDCMDVEGNEEKSMDIDMMMEI
jgi:dsRNA-specific ribonuclease